MKRLVGGSKRRTLLWEAVALLALAVAVGHLALPLLDELFLEREPVEVVIRAYVHEAGGFDPSVIKVRLGQTVRLIIMGMDVTHSFAIPELGIDSGTINPGHTKAIEFKADKAGVFEFLCLVYCSPEHPFMKGTLVVEE